MNQYSVVAKLGEGAFSVVHRVRRKEDGREYAMKKIRIATLTEKELGNCLNEVRILASIDHPYILAYKDSFYDEPSNSFCIVTECLDGGDVLQLIAKHRTARTHIDENTLWTVAYQCLKGLATLHEMNVLHRDIKCANIFLAKGQTQVKLADMNVSIVTDNGMARTQTGTPYYASPEVWMEKPYSAKCDIWSLGCVLYEMAALRPPFVSPDIHSLKKAIISGVYKRIPLQYSNELENFIRLCLRINPKERPSAGELLENQQIKTRNMLRERLVNEAALLSGTSSQQLIGKINIPRRRDFRNIKGLLPRHRFGQSSTQKITDNRSYCDEKDKQNTLNFVNTGKVTRKSELPNIQRSSSLNGRRGLNLNQRILCEEKPPLPKRPLRA